MGVGARGERGGFRAWDLHEFLQHIRYRECTTVSAGRF